MSTDTESYSDSEILSWLIKTGSYGFIDTFSRDEVGEDLQLATRARIVAAMKAEGVNPSASPAVWQPITTAPKDGTWVCATTKPEGSERRVLVWVVWPKFGWPSPPEVKIGWWKHGPGCFAVDEIENADHLVTHWMPLPSAPKE